MGVVADARTALAEGRDLGWTLPMVGALDPDGRRLSIEWVERAVRRLLPLAEVDDRAAVLAAIDGLRDFQGRAPTEQEVWERSFDISWPRWHAARIAVCHLYRAWWYSRFRANNQFVPSQEVALTFMVRSAGERPEHWNVVLAEFEAVAAESGRVI